MSTPEWDEMRKVLVSARLLDEIARAATGRGVRIDWGEPDGLGYYTPTLTYDESVPTIDVDRLHEALRTVLPGSFGTPWIEDERREVEAIAREYGKSKVSA